MTSFLRYINRARLSLAPKSRGSASSEVKNMRVQEVDLQMENLREEMITYYEDLSVQEKSVVKDMFNDPSFQEQFLANNQQGTFLLNSFNERITNFSPLHPTYPIVNTVHDCQYNLASINLDGEGIQAQILQEITQIIN